MANATTEDFYVGDGSTKQFSFTFPYIRERDVRVKLDKRLLSPKLYSFKNATQLRLQEAPEVGVEVRIFRQTGQDTISNTFYPGATIRARDLNDNFTQSLYISQEAKTESADSGQDAAAAQKAAEAAQAAAEASASDAAELANNALKKTGGVMTGDIAMTGRRIRNLASPVDPTDAASKAYVDSAVEAGGGGGGGGTGEGVTSITAGLGVSLDQPTGDVTISSTGVNNIVAGTGISVNQTTGNVIITATGGGGDGATDATGLSYTFPTGPERTAQQRFQDYVSVKDFGATGDGTTDDTATIQNAINAIQGTNRTLYFPTGSYKLESTGVEVTQGRPNANNGNYDYGSDIEYALLITQSIHIEATGATFLIDDADPSYQGFRFASVADSTFNGGNFLGTSSPTVVPSRRIFRGAGIALSICTGVTVSNVTFVNLKASVGAYSSDSCVIRDCLGIRNRQGPMNSGTFFGIYSGRYNTIENCQAYGGCYDGDIVTYGTGYGNQIRNSKAFNTLFGDATYTVFDPFAESLPGTDAWYTASNPYFGPGNQGIMLDAGQSAGVIDGCTAYGHWVGIDSKGGCGQNTLSNNLVVNNRLGVSVRAGEVNQDVAGHTLISNNTIIPNGGNGNTQNILGYNVVGIEISRAPSVTIEGNFIGVEQDPINNLGNSSEPVREYNFACINIISNAASLSKQHPGFFSILNNRFQNSTKFGPLTSQNTGPMIVAVGYWTSNNGTATVADSTNLNVSGNTFIPHPEKHTTFFNYFENFCSLIYNNNNHGKLVGANQRYRPYVETKGVSKVIASNNIFDRVGTAFKHTYRPDNPAPYYQRNLGFNANNNIFDQGISADNSSGEEPVIIVSGEGPCMVCNNSFWRRDRGQGTSNENPLLAYSYSTKGALICNGNIMDINQTTQSWYSVNGVNGAVGSNLCTDNNIINGTTIEA